MAVITRCSIAGSTEVQAACRRATKSICVVTTSRYTSSLRWPHRKKSNGVRSGERGGHRTGPQFRDVVTTQMDLVARLHAACTSVDPAMLQHVMTAIPRRAQACLDMHGGHFEHLL
ncbi:hypothetical protein AVEN_189746-1 [Araneus ventricosus]|uniref:Uncharacterized protein n=1 Tax=Araneus ventricosus TaxID=182803 RepID=A0A4Y2WX10_ARAVE|nr:hypothetical protein AVEN_189746-1 [Araneus ventricosus]